MNQNDIEIQINDFDNKNIGENIESNDDNNFNNQARNIQNNINNYNEMILLKEKNKKINLDKIGFFKFLIYTTKAEIHINSFKDLLYWMSLLEIFLYILSILLFISSPRNFYIFWTFTPHCVRGILGMIVLFRIPDSHPAVENIDNYDDSSIEALQEQMVGKYFQILQENEPRFKPILLTYFIFTVINIIIDVSIFFYLISKWENQEFSLPNIIGLLLIIVFFSNNFFLNLVCNTVYFSWFGSVKLTFPYEMWRPIRLAIFGSLFEIKKIVIEKTANAYIKAKNLLKRNNNESQGGIDRREVGVENNPQPNVIDR